MGRRRRKRKGRKKGRNKPVDSSSQSQPLGKKRGESDRKSVLEQRRLKRQNNLME